MYCFLVQIYCRDVLQNYVLCPIDLIYDCPVCSEKSAFKTPCRYYCFGGIVSVRGPKIINPSFSLGEIAEAMPHKSAPVASCISENIWRLELYGWRLELQ